MSLTASEQERLLESFRTFLEQEEEPIAPEDPVDLATLLGELAALKNEIRLESRQFKSAMADMRALTQGLQDDNARLVRDLERSREQSRETQRQSVRPLLLTLIDLHDRLSASHAAACAPVEQSWLARRFAGEGRRIEGLAEGLGLILSRLEDALSEQEVRAMALEGRPLDPRIARAIGVEQHTDQPDGIVLRAVRRGYHHEDSVLRLAEVIVNKKENSA